MAGPNDRAVPPDAYGPAQGAVPSESTVPRPSPPRKSRVFLGVGAGVVVVAMVVVAFVLSGGFHFANDASGSSATVLIPRGTSYSMIIGQFNGINFVIGSESKIQGQVNSSRGIQVYILTPAEFHDLVHNLTVGQYVWTSGIVADQVVYNLDVAVAPGQWVLSFVNPNVSFPTGVTFYSDVTLSNG